MQHEYEYIYIYIYIVQLLVQKQYCAAEIYNGHWFVTVGIIDQKPKHTID